MDTQELKLEKTPARSDALGILDLSGTGTTTGLSSSQLRRKMWLEITRAELVAVLLLAGAIIMLFFANLHRQPELDYDEGYFMLLARNLADFGAYTLQTSMPRADWFGYASSSPTVVLPMALAFELFGFAPEYGRAVIATYAIGLVASAWLLLRYLYGTGTAILGTLLLLVAGPLNDFNTLMMGRRVLTEVPAMFFLLLSLLIWLPTWNMASNNNRNALPRTLIAGVILGLSFITKEQFIIPVIPAVLILWLLDALHFRKVGWRAILLFLVSSSIPLLLWYGTKLYILGWDPFLQHLATLGIVSRASNMIISLSDISYVIWYLGQNQVLTVGIIGILYTLLISFRQRDRAMQSILLPLIAAGFLLWATFLTIGWARYTYTGIALSFMLAAKPLWDHIRHIPTSWSGLHAGIKAGTVAAPIAVFAVTLTLVLYPLQNIARQVVRDSHPAHETFSQFVMENTEANARLSSFAWEIVLLTDRQHLHPTPKEFANIIASNGTYAYDPRDVDAEYLIDSPYSKGSSLYTQAIDDDCCLLLGSVDAYDLYQVLD